MIILEKMTFDNMLTTAIFAIINLFFVLALMYIYNKNKVKYPGLRMWLCGAWLLMLASLIFVTWDFLNDSFFKLFVSFVGNIVLIASYAIILPAFLKIIGRKLNKLYTIIPAAIFSLIMIYATLYKYNGTIITLIVIFNALIVNIIILISLYKGRTIEQRKRWFPYVIMNVLPIIYSIVKFIHIVLIKNLPMSAILLHEGENLLLKTIIIIGTVNTIGLVATLNSTSPSYFDLENDLFSGIFSNVPFMVVAVDANTGLIQYINPGFTSETGYTRKDVINKMSLRDLHYSIDEFKSLEKVYYKQNYLRSEEVILLSKKGTKIHGALSVTSMLFEEGTYLISSIVNISKQVIKKEEYKSMALYDDLTLLPNRRPIIYNFERKIKEGKKFALVMLDLDNFKEINDKYGHIYGDETLRAVAKRLSIFSVGSNVVGRYGGDEFMLLLSVINARQTKTKITDILLIFNEPFTIKDKIIKVDASIGYACYPENGKTFDQLVEKADKALYQAKKANGDYAYKYYK